MTITRFPNGGFAISAQTTVFVNFYELDGEPAAYIRECGEPYGTTIQTVSPSDIYYVAYREARRAARWKAKINWRE